MNLTLFTAVAAGLCLSGGLAVAQDVAQPVPAAAQVQAAEAPATPVAPPAASGPTVAYVVRHEPPTFIMTRPANGALAMIGAFAAIAEGKRIATEYGFEEPANLVGADLAQAYAQAQGGQVAAEPIVLDDAHKDPLAANAGKVRYVVSVNPVSMNAIYFATKFGRYHLLFFTKAALVDTSTGKVLAKGQCKQVPDFDEATSPTYDQMMDNQAAGLKALIAASSKTCAETLKTQLFAASPAVRAN